MSDLPKRFTIWTEKIGSVQAEVCSENPNTAELILKALPIKGKANRWGDEIYFSTPVSATEENGRVEVEVGSVAYWPPGKAICIFFGPTPVSEGNAPRAASNVNVFARILGDSAVFKRVRDGDDVKLQLE
jgi:hypothetical protein